MDYQVIRFEQEGPIGVLTINRPDQLNALNLAVLTELRNFLTHDLKASQVRVLILTGSGEKAFVAGADIKEMKDIQPQDMVDFCDLGQRVADLLEYSDVVTIAAVNGYALGGGLEMALGCDFIYASENAQVGLPEVTLGIIPGFGGTQRLMRVAGKRVAKEMIFSGRRIKAAEAFELGIVNKVVPQAELLAACKDTAKQILKNSFRGVLQAKRALNYGEAMNLRDGLELEKQCCGVAFSGPDQKEGMGAFVEKRPAQFN